MTYTDTRRTTRKKPPTRRRATTTKPENQREVEWAKALDTALSVPGSVGNVYSRFYSYSYLNCILLMMQGAAEPVATYDRWKGMNRQVRKGEKALFIVRPIQVKAKPKDGEPDDGEARYFKKFRPVNCLFQVSQTDGEDLPPVEIPAWDERLALQVLKINQMPWVHVDGNVQGYSTGRGYAINPVAAYPHKTRFHEIAHIVLGHTSEDNHGEYAAHRGLFEFEAEATAYLVLKELDALGEAEARVSRGYIQGWLQDQQPGEPAIKRVFRAVNEILKAGRPQTTESQDS